MSKGLFEGRTISVVNDFSLDEQLYLYGKTKELKECKEGKASRFRIEDRNVAVYLIFLEDSTRTKESFRNAASFHNVRLNPFQAEVSSFNKKESYADTFKMLCGFCDYSIFVVRS